MAGDLLPPRRGRLDREVAEVERSAALDQVDEPVLGCLQRRVGHLGQRPPLILSEIRRRRAIPDQVAAVIRELLAGLGALDPGEALRARAVSLKWLSLA
jgi:hypothetical protein